MPFGATLLLQNNGADDLLIEVDGRYAFPRRVTGTYEVTIARQPGIAECAVSNGSGTAVADVTDVAITCVPLWSIGGTLAGLPAGDSVTLTNNGADALTLTADGDFRFPKLVKGTYLAAISVQPTGARCSLERGAGTATANVTDLAVTCWATCAAAALDCGHGTCSDTVGAPRCVCDTGYEGATCSSCAAGYQDKDLNGTCLADCDHSGLGTCSGHGACSDASGTATCGCDAAYTGATCSSCATNYQDQNGDGTCLPDCDHSGLGNCSGHGACSDISGTATCGCDAAYTGTTCSSCATDYQDKDLDGTCLPDCDHSGLGNCSGHGTCSDTSGTATCGCDAAYTGATCSSCATNYQDKNGDGTCLPDCDHSGLGNCSGHGACSDISGTATCGCTSPWTGTLCDVVGPFTLMYSGAGIDRPTAVAVDPANGNLYVLIGSASTTFDFGNGVTTTNRGQSDMILLALDPLGVPRWARDVGGDQREDANKVVVDSAGNVVVTGSTYSSTLYFDDTHTAATAAIRPFVASYTSAGDFRWGRVFGSGEGTALAADGAGNVFAAGTAAGAFDYDEAGPLPTLTPPANGVYLLSLDTNGATRWANVYGSNYSTSGTMIRDLAIDAAGNAYGTGYISAINANLGGGVLPYNPTCNCSEIFLASWDNTGAHRRSKSFLAVDFRSYDAFAVAVDGTGRLALAARWGDTLDFGGGPLTHPTPGQDAGALAIFNSTDGSFRSQRLFTTGLPFVIYDLAFVSSGLYMVGNSNNHGCDLGAGVQYSGAFWAQYSLGTGDSLDYVAGRVAGGGAYPLATGVCVAPSGAVYAVGDTSGTIDWGSGMKSALSSWDAWLARLK